MTTYPEDEDLCSFETSVNIYKSKLSNNPEELDFDSRSCRDHISGSRGKLHSDALWELTDVSKKPAAWIINLDALPKMMKKQTPLRNC